MEEKTVLIGATVLLVLAGGLIATNNLLVNKTSTLPAEGEEASASACESALDSQVEIMNQGERREIPASCFQNKKPITDRISGAEPGDSFRKTDSGIKVVE